MFTLIRYLLAFAIVAAGAVWGVVWLRGVIKKSPKTDWALLRKMPLYAWAAWIGTAAYALFYFAVALWVGGVPNIRLSGGGSYWLNWSGKTTQVSRETYMWSEVRQVVLVALVIGTFVLSGKVLTKYGAPKKN